MNIPSSPLKIVLAVLLGGPLAFAQSTPAADPCQNPTYRQCSQNLPQKTLYLNNASQQADANEVVTAIRNILPPETKVYLVASQDAIVVRGLEADIALAQKLIAQLDLPKKTYRLTYTVSDMEGTRLINKQSFEMQTVNGQNTVLKEGSKVPIATGSFNTAATENKAAGIQTQYTYLDVGMNFNTTVTAMNDSAMLKAVIVRSAIAPQQSGVGAQDPIVNQTELSGIFVLVSGKPTRIGSLDMPGTTHHLDIEATLEPIR